MKKPILILVSFLIILNSCDLIKSGNSLKIEVIDVSLWSPDNPFGEKAVSANVKLLDINNPDINQPLFEKETNSAGIAEFEEIPDGDYYVYIEKGSSSNLVSQEIKDGMTVGFLISGLFHDQLEVEESIQPGAFVGAPKLLDKNGDQVFNINDKEPGNKILLYHNEEDTYLIADKAFAPNEM